MTLRLEIPKPLPNEPIYCKGIRAYLDNKRIDRVWAIDSSISKHPMKKIDDYTFEFYGEFELREVEEHKGLVSIYG